jgi:hypothetical protein
LNENWYAVCPRLPVFDLHHHSCPRNANPSRGSKVLSKGRVHDAIKSLCTCAGSLTVDQKDVFDYITKTAMHSITSDLCAIIDWKHEYDLSEVFAMCVAEKACFLENVNAEYYGGGTERPYDLFTDIEVYLRSKVECDIFTETCVTFLRDVNNRHAVVSPNGGEIIVRHRLNINEKCPFIKIKVFPHKAVRKGWNKNPCSFIYIDNAMEISRDTAALRSFVVDTVFTKHQEAKDFRRIVITGGNSDYNTQLRTKHDWIEFREQGSLIRQERLKRQHEYIEKHRNELIQRAAATTTTTATTDTNKEKEKEQEKEEDFSKAVEPQPMTDEEFEMRQRFKALKVLKEEEKKAQQLSDHNEEVVV